MTPGSKSPGRIAFIPQIPAIISHWSGRFVRTGEDLFSIAFFWKEAGFSSIPDSKAGMPIDIQESMV